MKTLQTMRGRLPSFALVNILVFGFLMLESKIYESQVRHGIPALQISKYSAPETAKPATVNRTLCACIQGWSRQA